MSTAADYDPFAPDPAAAYPQLRSAECPVHHYQGDGGQFFVLSRHADVRAVLSDAALYSVRYGQMHTYCPGQGLTVDPPVHTILRRLLNPLFTARRVALLEPPFAEFEQVFDVVLPRPRA